MRELFCKPASDTLDYVVDFRRSLRQGERITSATATVTETPEGLQILKVEFSSETVTVWLLGGRDLDRHTVTVSMKTSAEREMTRDFLVDIHGTAERPPEVAPVDTSVTVGFLNTYVPGARLRTDGASIVRTTGEQVVIKAINWFGFESSNRIVHGLWAVGYKAAIDQMAAMGFNAIRLPFAADTFNGTRPTGVDFTKPGNTVFQVTGTGNVKPALDCMDIIINYAAEKGMWVLLDHHRRAVGTGADGNPTSSTYTEAQWIATWQTLAARYGGNPAVIGADLYNEPHQLTWNDWAGMAERCGNAIHLIAPDWLIVVEGVGSYNGRSYWQGGQLMGVRDRPVALSIQNRLVYSPHEYGQSVATQPWLKTDAQPNVQNWPVNLDGMWRDNWGYIAEQGIAPIFIGEFGGKLGFNGSGVDNQPNGANEREWFNRLVAKITAEGTSTAFWSFNPNSADTGGIVQDDWKTPQLGKLALLQPYLGS
ncbi:glycoside hydrolase family 5 protein [Pseudomonas sp.]|uniref:glycoside hydrolase family 5 protein n=1 Tax=Pseudomonas sp. TaxID=306 RepID=UPI00258ADF44|nr:glycoside hydrolase family 5 protein [Pseudomonas sp.]